ncbi:IS66 family transposase [Granulosicoccus sp. 3-233]|uniref:IS66 family transposase n=1 Tax=Granulosicoccus sp. 3-233 TaxID=3417969 RepID=UPI003D351B6D
MPDFTRFAATGLSTPDAMMVALFEQQKMLSEKEEQLAESHSLLQNHEARLANQQALIAVLEERLRLMQQRQFGSKSEKNLLQDDWLADEAETLVDGKPDSDDGEIDPDDEQKDPGKQKKPRKKKARKGFSADLPRIQRFITLSDEEREGALETFFVKVKEELDIIPAQVQVIEIMQEKAVFLDEHGERSLKAAERPAHPIGRSVASINLLAWVVIAKYADALPLYRLEKILARYGGEITRTTLANWIIRLSVTVQPLLRRLEAQLMKADYLQGDETRLQVLKEPGMAATGDKWIWLLRGGPPGKTVVSFNYDKSRGGAVVERLLEHFTGNYFQSDGYSGYDKPCAAKKVVHLGCWDHARRKVAEAIKTHTTPDKGKPSVAMVMLSHINALYRLEREWSDLDDDERWKERQKKAIPKLAKFKLWLEQKQPTVAKDTLTRKAINYTLNQWEHLVRYCEWHRTRMPTCNM